MSNIPPAAEQLHDRHEFGGPFDAFLGAVALGVPVVGEFVTAENPTLKWTLVVVSIGVGGYLGRRLCKSETLDQAEVPLHEIDLSGQL
ncbi:MAG: hypothetical protein WA843_04095 [Candidatus Saccharimonadales bacterium]